MGGGMEQGRTMILEEDASNALEDAKEHT